MAKHPIVHLDIPADDTGAAAQFYADVFDWEPVHMAEVNYWMFRAEGGPGGGFVNPGPSGSGPDYKIGDVRVYIDTDDIEASLSAIEAHGGKRLGPTVDMGPNGAYTFFADPAGNVIGLYKSPAQDS